VEPCGRRAGVNLRIGMKCRKGGVFLVFFFEFMSFALAERPKI
jgi:hypothetical protein